MKNYKSSNEGQNTKPEMIFVEIITHASFVVRFAVKKPMSLQKGEIVL